MISFSYQESLKNQIMTSTSEYQLSFSGAKASQSSPYAGNSFPAVNAINGSNKTTHTKKGIGMWWKVVFPKNHNIQRIKIRNRIDCCGERLAGSMVFVSEQLCGQLPNRTLNGEWYELQCDILGNEIKIVTVRNTYLSISNIKVYASPAKLDCSGDLCKLQFINVSQSSPFNNNEFPAINAIDGSEKYSMTNKGVGMWWKSKWNKNYNFKKIRILNRNDSGHLLSKTMVFINDQVCGQLPRVTINSKWYEVECELSGNEVRLVTVKNTHLSFSGIEAYVENPNI